MQAKTRFGIGIAVAAALFATAAHGVTLSWDLAAEDARVVGTRLAHWPTAPDPVQVVTDVPITEPPTVYPATFTHTYQEGTFTTGMEYNFTAWFLDASGNIGPPSDTVQWVATDAPVVIRVIQSPGSLRMTVEPAQ